MSKNIRVVPKGNSWAVQRDGGSRAISNHRTQGTAIDRGREVAKREGGELFIHRPNGQIRDRDSFGRDPFPPRG